MDTKRNPDPIIHGQFRVILLCVTIIFYDKTHKQSNKIYIAYRKIKGEI